MSEPCRFPGCTRMQGCGTYFCDEEHTALWVKSSQRKWAFNSEGGYEAAVEDFIAEHASVAQPVEHSAIHLGGSGSSPDGGAS